MADGRHVEKYFLAIILHWFVWFSWNFVRRRKISS